MQAVKDEWASQALWVQMAEWYREAVIASVKEALTRLLEAPEEWVPGSIKGDVTRVDVTFTVDLTTAVEALARAETEEFEHRLPMRLAELSKKLEEP